MLTEAHRPALHQSSLAMLYRCPKQYEFRHIDGVIDPPGVAAAVGTGVHCAVDADLTHKINEGALLPDDAIADTARDGLNAVWEQGVVLGPDEREAGDAATRGAAVDRAVALAGLHHGTVAPGLNPTHVEREWRLTLEGYPYDLAGRMDIVEPDAIRDTKTSAKSPSKGMADTSLQLTTYAVAARFTDGELPPHLYLDYLVSLKTPKAVTLGTTRDDEDVAIFLRRLDIAMRQLGAGVFPPCNPCEWWCSPRWCGYWDKCPYVRGHATVTVTKEVKSDGQ